MSGTWSGICPFASDGRENSNGIFGAYGLHGPEIGIWSVVCGLHEGPMAVVGFPHKARSAERDRGLYSRVFQSSSFYRVV